MRGILRVGAPILLLIGTAGAFMLLVRVYQQEALPHVPWDVYANDVLFGLAMGATVGAALGLLGNSIESRY